MDRSFFLHFDVRHIWMEYTPCSVASSKGWMSWRSCSDGIPAGGDNRILTRLSKRRSFANEITSTSQRKWANKVSGSSSEIQLLDQLAVEAVDRQVIPVGIFEFRDSELASDGYRSDCE